MGSYKYIFQLIVLMCALPLLVAHAAETEKDSVATSRKLSFDDQMGALLAQQHLKNAEAYQPSLPISVTRERVYHGAIALTFIWLAYDFYNLYHYMYVPTAEYQKGKWAKIVQWIPFVTMEHHIEFFLRGLTPIMRTAVVLALIRLIKLSTFFI